MNAHKLIFVSLTLFALFACSSSRLLLGPINTNAVCNRGSVSMKCNVYETITVDNVTISGSDVCRFRGPRGNCSSPYAISNLQNQCKDSRFCKGTLNRELFGSTCRSLKGEISAKYSCNSGLIKSLACEGSAVTMSCPSDKVMYIVNAMYGRNSDTTCRASTRACPSQLTSLTQTKISCDGKQSCSFPCSNDYFSEPCGGVPKFCVLEYICAKGVKTVTSADGSSLYLKCDSGTIISILKAVYQKQDNSCAFDITAPVITTCDSKNSCVISTSANNYGGQCGTETNLFKIDYKCEPVV